MYLYIAFSLLQNYSTKQNWDKIMELSLLILAFKSRRLNHKQKLKQS